MKSFAVIVVSFAIATGASAQRNALKPMDFVPLTELPWKDPTRPMIEIMEAIYLEPNPDIRYSVLTGFFRHLPVSELGKAFELAMVLEGTQSPDHIADVLLQLWAVRDPEAAWKRTEGLFRIAGNVGHWLGLGYWTTRIVVGDAIAIQRARYWLSPETLAAFYDGCRFSDLPNARKQELRTAFCTKWKRHFGDDFEEGMSGGPAWFVGADAADSDAVLQAFEWEPRAFSEPSSPLERIPMVVRQVQWRRWLMAHPNGMAAILGDVERTSWSFKETLGGGSDSGKATLPREMLLLWFRVNPEAIKLWAAKNSSTHHSEASIHAKAMLMNIVDEEQQQAWLRSMLRGEEGFDHLNSLAEWNLPLAMRSVGLVDSPDLELSCLVDGAYGPFSIWNSSHSGYQYLIDHGLEEMPGKVRDTLLKGTSWFQCTFMEQWGDLDIGEAARFGHRIIMQEPRVDKQEMIQMYTGEIDGDVDDGLIDRTFCALRAWAVVRPAEMREWIETQREPEMRKALLWMLEHPWGKSSSN